MYLRATCYPDLNSRRHSHFFTRLKLLTSMITSWDNVQTKEHNFFINEYLGGKIVFSHLTRFQLYAQNSYSYCSKYQNLQLVFDRLLLILYELRDQNHDIWFYFLMWAVGSSGLVWDIFKYPIS